jgi:hypothetical protein
MLGGQVIVGGVESSTVMLKKQPAEFEDASVPVQATNVVPTGKSAPEGGEHATDTPEQLSVTMAGG